MSLIIIIYKIFWTVLILKTCARCVGVLQTCYWIEVHFGPFFSSTITRIKNICDAHSPSF